MRAGASRRRSGAATHASCGAQRDACLCSAFASGICSLSACAGRAPRQDLQRFVASLADAGRARARACASLRAPRALKTHVRAHSPALPAWARGLDDSPSLLRCQLHCGGGEEDNGDARDPQAARDNDGRVERPDSVEERRACKLTADKGNEVKRGADLSSARGRGTDQRSKHTCACMHVPRCAQAALRTCAAICARCKRTLNSRRP